MSTPTDPVRVSLAPEPGDESPRYEEIRRLGAGSMGDVIAARDHRLGRIVAMKRLLSRRTREPASVRRFHIEAQICAQLEHPHIVPVYEIDAESARPSFTMRLLGQRTLNDFLDECRAPANRGDEQHAQHARLALMGPLVDAMDYAHTRGVIHRDLKPSNVVLGHHGELYVVDWGIAKILGDDSATEDLALEAPVTDGEQTQLGSVLGTPTYMPPEQALGNVPAHGPASDQFALGMILQELVTLEAPRTGDGLDTVLAAAEARRVPLPASVAPELRAIIERATSEAPEDRYPSVTALGADVERYLRGAPVSVYREDFSKRVWRRLSRRPALSLGLGLGALVVTLSAAVLGLVAALVVQAYSAAEQERTQQLAAEVVRRSEQIDSRFAQAAELVEGIAMAATTLHEGDRPLEGPIPYGAAAQLAETAQPRFTDLHDVAGYDYPVSFTRPMFHYPDGVDEPAARRHLRVFSPLARELRHAFLRSLDEEAPAWPRARQDAALDAGEVPLWALYVAFDVDGLMLSYPGWIPLADQYDARRRPWYRHVVDRAGIRFGNPYVDAAGGALILPCNRALRDSDGRFVGVAGGDFTLDDLSTLMRIDEPGWRRSSLVDAEGRELVNTNQEGLRLEARDDDSAETGTPLAPALAARVRADQTGWMHLEDELVVFDRLEEPGWTFVAHFDADVALEASDE